MCTKYEVSMFNPVLKRGVHRHEHWFWCRCQHWQRSTDKAWLCKALWLINQMNQKVIHAMSEPVCITYSIVSNLQNFNTRRWSLQHKIIMFVQLPNYIYFPVNSDTFWNVLSGKSHNILPTRMKYNNYRSMFINVTLSNQVNNLAFTTKVNFVN